MKKFLVLLFVFISTVCLGQEVRYVNSVELNIRQGAGTEFSVVSKLSKGDKVTVLSDSNNWSLIETSDGRKGFVASKFLNTSSTEPNQTPKKGTDKWITILVFGIIGVIGIIRFFTKKGSNSNNYRQPQEKAVRNSNSENKNMKSNHWYRCRRCREKIQSQKTPSSLGCSNSSMHKWDDLGEVGQDNYSCRKCGLMVQTKKTPSSFGCSNDSMHNWYKQ